MSVTVQKTPAAPFVPPAKIAPGSSPGPEARGFSAELQRALVDNEAGAEPGEAPRDPNEVRAFSDLSFSARAVSQGVDSPDAPEAEPANTADHPEVQDKSGARAESTRHEGRRDPGPAPAHANGRHPMAAILPNGAAGQEPGRNPDLRAFTPLPGVKQGQVTTAIHGREQVAQPFAPAPPARPGGGQLQGHFVSLLPGAEGLEVRIRTGARDDDDRRNIESMVAAWLVSRGVRIAALSVDGAAGRKENKGERG